MKIDLSTIDDIEDLRAGPIGEYHCRIAEVRESTSPAGHTRWGLRWEVLTGDYLGRTACWDSLHWSERGLPRVKYALQTFGLPSDGELDLQPGALVGLEAMVTIQAEEREDPVTGIRRVMNRVPFSGYAPAPAVAASTKR
jgi:hypothetical protein